MKIRPLADKVLVKPAEAEERTPGGIIIPQNAKVLPTRGEVLAVGPGRIGEDGARIPVGVSPGNVVLYNKYGGQDVEIDGEMHKILNEGDLLGVEE